MKNQFILFALLLSFLNQAQAFEVCEQLFRAKYPGRLGKITSKTAQNNYGKLKKTLDGLSQNNSKIAFGSKNVTAKQFLSEVKAFYTGKKVPASYKPSNYFDEIDDVFESIKRMPESELMIKLQESMKRYTDAYKKTFGKNLELPGSHTYSNGKTLDKMFHEAATGTQTNFSKYIDEVIMVDSKSNKADLLRGEFMAWYGQEMDLLFEPIVNQVKRKAASQVSGNSVSVTKAQVKNWNKRAELIEEVKEAKYKISRAVNRFEQFNAKQVEKVAMDSFVMTKSDRLGKLTNLELDDYETYTRGLLYDLAESGSFKRYNGDKFTIHVKDVDHKNIKKMYGDIDEGGLGILSIKEYRDIVSKNTFPLFIKRHDMRHIHYATSHPRALGTVMGSTRSQNHLRFSQLGGMYEAIETNQYGFESSIAEYFSKEIKDNSFLMLKRNMDLEESMITLGSIPKPFQIGIGEAHGHGSHWRQSVNELVGWTPKTVVTNMGEAGEQIILDGSLRLKRGVKDGKQVAQKVAKIKNPDGSIQELPVYLNSQGKYSSITEMDPKLVSLNEDIELMVKKFQTRLEDYQSMRANLIKRANADGKPWYEVITEEEEMLMHLYNYQKDPDNPAVRIAITKINGDEVSDIAYINDQMLDAGGVKWKNDGRAHYSGDGNSGEFGVGSGTNTD